MFSWKLIFLSMMRQSQHRTLGLRVVILLLLFHSFQARIIPGFMRAATCLQLQLAKLPLRAPQYPGGRPEACYLWSPLLSLAACHILVSRRLTTGSWTCLRTAFKSLGLRASTVSESDGVLLGLEQRRSATANEKLGKESTVYKYQIYVGGKEKVKD